MRITDGEIDTPLRLTGRQKLAIMLEKGGYTHQQIADKLGIKQPAVSRLIARGKAAQAALVRAVEEFIAPAA
jgi:predicted transcriptional regulator